MMPSTFWIIEKDAKSFKIAFVEDGLGRPCGSEKNGNYVIIAEGLTESEADAMLKRLRASEH